MCDYPPITETNIGRTRQNAPMGPRSDHAGELLRARGLRSTPQRRAILGAFRGGASEHLSADEVYARAAESLPDLSRGTVYATLAEFSELGLLSAFGAPEPVRYETNTIHHSHFRCRLCLRTFDLASGLQDPEEITDPGFSVERVDMCAEGICAECNAYDAGLKAGARAISQSGPAGDTLGVAGVATAIADGPLGPLALAATPHGLTRVAFEGHGDFDALRAHAASRRGSQAARRHLTGAAARLHDYFAGNTDRIAWVVDWAFLESAGAAALGSIGSIPYAGHRSYVDLPNSGSARDLGWIMGANPIPIVAPCHRVTRGIEVPTTFVGGSARRHWLENHETTFRDAPSQ
jgi:Fe2+ or Zn2+ uptake regulation protein/O6-methylguanine-DNA--protein-cysteine methyltransferase